MDMKNHLIDYEAAWGYLRSEDHGQVLWSDRDELVTIDKVHMMAAIDTALGLVELRDSILKAADALTKEAQRLGTEY